MSGLRLATPRRCEKASQGERLVLSLTRLPWIRSVSLFDHRSQRANTDKPRQPSKPSAEEKKSKTEENRNKESPKKIFGLLGIAPFKGYLMTSSIIDDWPMWSVVVGPHTNEFGLA